ncbi:MAG: hypothetical protein NC429_00875, partial [Lachnospiraceae bacterium]|nr:hypothetical protein [Lachnospiraceae bacterium]
MLAVMRYVVINGNLLENPTQPNTIKTVNHSTIAKVQIGKDTLFTDSLYGDLFLKEPIKKHQYLVRYFRT